MIAIEHQANIITSSSEIIIAISGLFLLLCGVCFGNKFRSFSIIGSIIAFLLSIYSLIDLVGIEKNYALNNFFVSNSFIVYSKLLLLFSAILINILHSAAKHNQKSKLKDFEFPILMMFSVLGMMIMISANDFLTLYMGLEMQSLCLYVLIAFEREDSKASEAGLKYFVLGALSSGLFLYGISLIYGFAGSTNFVTLEKLFTHNHGITAGTIGIIVGMVLIIIGFCFKISAVPFHMWAPDVYQGAPTIVTLFLASLPKVAAITLLARIMIELFSDWNIKLQQILVLVSALSIFVGSFGAIKQTNIKRLLAYSSIVHVGFILIAIASGSFGTEAVLIYCTIYLTMIIATFSCILMLKHNSTPVEDLLKLKGIGKTKPFVAAMISVLMFSMAGIPPFAGFYAKFYVFRASLDAHLYILAILGIIASVIAAFYYLRIIKYIYFEEAVITKFDRSSKRVFLIASSLTGFNLLYFLFPSLFTEIVLYIIKNM